MNIQLEMEEQDLSRLVMLTILGRRESDVAPLELHWPISAL
jgi:hypothetical protein